MPDFYEKLARKAKNTKILGIIFRYDAVSSLAILRSAKATRSI
jgi:hypothetical protein